MRKGKTNGAPACEALDFRFEGEDLILTTSGKDRYRIDALKALSLFDGSKIRAAIAAEKAGETVGGRSEFITAVRLLKKGLTLPQAAAAMGIPEPEFRRFYNSGIATFDLGRQLEQAAMKRQEAEGHDYVKAIPREQEYPGQKIPESFVLVQVPDVARLRLAGLEDDGIAAKLGVNRVDFAAWLKANEEYLPFCGMAVFR